MRELADAARIEAFMRGLADTAKRDGRVYFTGGTTAVLMGWRPTTVDVDARFVPEHDELLRAIPALKETLQLNVELASPPAPPPAPAYARRPRSRPIPRPAAPARPAPRRNTLPRRARSGPGRAAPRAPPRVWAPAPTRA